MFGYITMRNTVPFYISTVLPKIYVSRIRFTCLIHPTLLEQTLNISPDMTGRLCETIGQQGAMDYILSITDNVSTNMIARRRYIITYIESASSPEWCDNYLYLSGGSVNSDGANPLHINFPYTRDARYNSIEMQKLYVLAKFYIMRRALRALNQYQNDFIKYQSNGKTNWIIVINPTQIYLFTHNAEPLSHNYP